MKWFLALVVAAAACGAAWLALGGDGTGSDGPPDAAGRPDAAPERRSPVLAGVGAEGAGAGEPAARGRCAVEGRTLADGRPAAGATVEALLLAGREAIDPLRPQTPWISGSGLFSLPPEPGPVAARSTGSPDGTFRLDGLAPGIYRVIATLGAAQAQLSVTLPEDGARASVVLDLLPLDQTLSGSVRWADGTAFRGSVVLTPVSAEFRGVGGAGPLLGAGSIVATIAADGAFRIERLARGTYGVRVLGTDGFGAQGPLATLPADKPYAFVLPAGAETVTGRVLDATSGEPLAGAEVVAMSGRGRSGGTGWRGVADGDGRFTIGRLSYPVTLSAKAPGYAAAQRLVEKAQGEVALRLTRTARITGRVRTKDGAPAPGAVVVAALLGGGGEPRTRAVADREGRYALEELRAGAVTVFVRGGGWVSPELGDVQADGYNPLATIAPGGGTLSLDLTAVPAARLSGRVLEAGGAPVAGAVVRASGRSGGARLDWSLMNALGTDTAISAADGAFSLDSLVPDIAVHLTADAPDQPQASAGPVSVSAEAPGEVELRFPVPRWLDVTVRFEDDGSPVVDASVSLATRRGGGTTEASRATTDGEGHARLGPAGEGELGARVSGGGVAIQAAPTYAEGSAQGAGPFALTLRVGRGLTITGRVVRADGRPAPTAGVNGSWEGGETRGGANAVADADGRFTLEGLPAGPVRLWARDQGRGAREEARATARAGDRDVVLTLTAGGTGDALVVRVLDERGEPVRQFQARLSSGGGSWGTGGREGSVRFDIDASPGSIFANGYRAKSLYLEVFDARGDDGLPLGLAPARVGPLTEDQKDLEVRLGAGGSVEGRVLGAGGAPLPGVLVRARPQADAKDAARGLEPQAAGESRSDATGRFRVTGLSQGPHQLEVAPPPDYLASPPVPVEPGAQAVEIQFVRGVTARVRVLDPDGLPVAGATVRLQPTPPENATAEQQQAHWRLANRPGGSPSLTTDVGGAARFRGLNPEALYSLQVQVPPRRMDLKGATRQGWRPSDTEVRLEAGFFVSGVVRDTQGKPVSGATVMHKLAEQNWGGEGTQQDGTFRIVGLSAGTVTLKARPPSSNWSADDESSGAEVTVPVGTMDIVLVVDRGLELVVRVLGLDERRGRLEGLNALLLRRQPDGTWQQAGWGWGQPAGEAVRVAFTGLKADERYAVWIQPQGEEYGWAADLKAGAEATLRMQRGASIRGRLSVPAGLQNLQVSANDGRGLWASGLVEADGRYEIKGLPDGRWTVSSHAQSADGGVPWHAQGEAPAGGTLDLTLQARGGGR